MFVGRAKAATRSPGWGDGLHVPYLLLRQTPRGAGSPAEASAAVTALMLGAVTGKTLVIHESMR